MMGWKPNEVRAASVPEFLATFDGFQEFHGASSRTEPATYADLEDLMRMYPD